MPGRSLETPPHPYSAEEAWLEVSDVSQAPESFVALQLETSLWVEGSEKASWGISCLVWGDLELRGKANRSSTQVRSLVWLNYWKFARRKEGREGERKAAGVARNLERLRGSVGFIPQALGNDPAMTFPEVESRVDAHEGTKRRKMRGRPEWGRGDSTDTRGRRLSRAGMTPTTAIRQWRHEGVSGQSD